MAEAEKLCPTSRNVGRPPCKAVRPRQVFYVSIRVDLLYSEPERGSLMMQRDAVLVFWKQLL